VSGGSFDKHKAYRDRDPFRVVCGLFACQNRILLENNGAYLEEERPCTLGHNVHHLKSSMNEVVYRPQTSQTYDENGHRDGDSESDFVASWCRGEEGCRRVYDHVLYLCRVDRTRGPGSCRVDPGRVCLCRRLCSYLSVFYRRDGTCLSLNGLLRKGVAKEAFGISRSPLSPSNMSS
jgi:hypothetical protein